MVGIPEADLAEWRSRRSQGSSNNNGQPSAKRQKTTINVALTPEQLKAQLEAHKALMAGHAPPPSSIPLPPYGNGPGQPSQQPTGPPPAFPPPSGQFNRPPPPFGGPPPPAFGYPVGPPPGFGGSPYAGPPPTTAAGPSWSPGNYSGPPPPIAPHITAPPPPSPHQLAVRSGAKSRLVYTDTALSPEEKLASSSKYAYMDPDEAPGQPGAMNGYHQAMSSPYQGYQQQQQPDSTGYSGAQQGYGGARPPPSVANSFAPPHGYGSPIAPLSGPSAASPYGGAQASSYASPSPYSGPPSGPSRPPPPPSSSGMQAMSPSGAPYEQPAQSYPAVPPGAAPPAQDPEANTAEALAKTNVSAAIDPATIAAREAEVSAMQKQADVERKEDVEENIEVTSTLDEKEAATSTKAVGRGRARASDLF
jgi:hypothetical protein